MKNKIIPENFNDIFVIKVTRLTLVRQKCLTGKRDRKVNETGYKA